MTMPWLILISGSSETYAELGMTDETELGCNLVNPDGSRKQKGVFVTVFLLCHCDLVVLVVPDILKKSQI